MTERRNDYNIVLEQKLIVLGQLHNDQTNPYMLEWIKEYEYAIVKLAYEGIECRGVQKSDHHCKKLLDYIKKDVFNLGDCYEITVYQNTIYAYRIPNKKTFFIFNPWGLDLEITILKISDLLNHIRLLDDWRSRIGESMTDCGWNKLFQLLSTVSGKYIEFISDTHKKYGIIKTFEIIKLTGLEYDDYYYYLKPNDKWINSYDDYKAYDSYEKESRISQELLQTVRSYLVGY
jgi:hypothetical protein